MPGIQGFSLSRFDTNQDDVKKNTHDNDNEIDTLLEGPQQNKKIDIIRCCTAPNEPWVKLKSRGVNGGGGGGETQIILPMPVQLRSQETPSWEGASLGKIGLGTKIIEDAYSKAMEIMRQNGDAQAVGGMAKEAFEQFISDAGGWGEIMKSGIAGDFQGIAKKGGIAILPPKELRFQGISFRNFTFDWKLVPLDERQSQQIEKAIYKLQLHSLPGGDAGVVAYPDLWDISFGPRKPHHIMYIKTCACTNITVDYSGAGRSVFHTDDLWPIVVQLSLSFTEETLHSRKDVRSGIYG